MSNIETIGMVVVFIVIGLLAGSFFREAHGMDMELEQMFQNPYWTVDNYETAFCKYHESFVQEADDRNIEYDRADEDIRVWQREFFDMHLNAFAIVVIGDRPNLEERMC